MINSLVIQRAANRDHSRSPGRLFRVHDREAVHHAVMVSAAHFTAQHIPLGSDVENAVRVRNELPQLQPRVLRTRLQREDSVLCVKVSLLLIVRKLWFIDVARAIVHATHGQALVRVLLTSHLTARHVLRRRLEALWWQVALEKLEPGVQRE